VLPNVSSVPSGNPRSYSTPLLHRVQKRHKDRLASHGVVDDLVNEQNPVRVGVGVVPGGGVADHRISALEHPRDI
jgi:hypothetical protein